MTEFKCIKCLKTFSNKYNLQRHFSSCKENNIVEEYNIIQELTSLKQVNTEYGILLKSLSERFILLQKTVEDQQKLIDEQQKEIELLKAQPKEVNSLVSHGNHNVNANKIIVNNISSSNTNYILQLLPKFFNMIYDGKSSTSVRDELMVCIWNNPEHPENHIFYLPNIKKDTVVIQDGENFRIASFNEIEPDIGIILNKVNIDFHEKKTSNYY